MGTDNKSDATYVEGSAAVLYNEKIYFSSFNPVGCLYCFDMKTETTTFLKQFSIENSVGMCHVKAVLYGNEAWFIPWDARRLVCVNLDTLEEKYHEIEGHDYENGHAFIDCLFCETNKLILIPSGHGLRTMVIVDLQKHLTKEFPNVIPERKCIGAYVWEKKLHFLSVSGDEISIFNLEKMEVEHLYEGEDTSEWMFSSIVQDKETVYFIPRKSQEICILQLETGEKHRASLPVPTDKFWGGICIYNGLLMYNWRTEQDTSYWGEDENCKLLTRCIRVDKKENRAELIFFPRGRTKRIQQYMTQICLNKQKKMIMGNDGYLFLLDEYGNITKKWDYSIEITSELMVPKLDRRITIKDIKKRNPNIIMENKMLNLKAILSALARKE